MIRKRRRNRRNRKLTRTEKRTRNRRRTPSDTVGKVIGVDPHTQTKQSAILQQDVMARCIAEINRVEAEAKAAGTTPLSRNKISRSFGLAPSTVSKRMMGKVVRMGPQSRGVRRGRVFAEGKFQATQ